MFDDPAQRGRVNINECRLIVFQPWCVLALLEESGAFDQDKVPNGRVRV